MASSGGAGGGDPTDLHGRKQSEGFLTLPWRVSGEDSGGHGNDRLRMPLSNATPLRLGNLANNFPRPPFIGWAHTSAPCTERVAHDWLAEGQSVLMRLFGGQPPLISHRFMGL